MKFRFQRGVLYGMVKVCLLFTLTFAIAFIKPVFAQGTLEVPELVWPTNGEEDVPVNPALEWNEVTEADTYDLQLATDSGFSEIVEDQTGLTGNTFGPGTLEYNTEYFWRMRALNETDTSEWSASRSFTTELTPTTDPPSLVSPANGATGVSINPELSWQSVDGAVSYRVELADNDAFSSPILNETTGATSLNVSTDLAHNQTYHWRVYAINDDDVESGPSDTWSFTTELTPATLVSPSDGATDVPINPELSWQSVDGAVSYIVELAADDGFSSLIVDESGVTGTSFTVSTDLDYTQTYYWRVFAVNIDDIVSEPSDTWSFTTQQILAPDAPDLISPEDQATGVHITPELSWEEADRADTYHIQVATNPNFNNPSRVEDETGLTEITFEPGNLSYETDYYWRVRGVNVGGNGDWSEIRRFTTQEEPLQPPSVPALSSPEDEATNISINPLLEWEAATDASSYEVQVSTDSGFDTVDYSEENISSLSHEIATDLAYETTYFWRVRAVNEAGESAWADEWSFTTQQAPPSVPVLASPEDGATEQPLNVQLSWNTADRADTYDIRIATSSGFSQSDIIEQQSGLSETSYNPENLEYNTEYFWQVLATNNTGASDWSDARSFSTQLTPATDVPTLISPEDQATGISITPELNWQAVDGAESYRVQLSGEDDFSSLIIDEDEITEANWTVTPDLDYNQTYFWRAYAINEDGVQSPASDIWSFTTELTPATDAPILVSPLNGATDISINPELNWQTVDGAESYRVQLATDDSFSSPVVNETTTQTSLNVSTDLDYNRTYYWRVYAINVDDVQSDPSDIWSFTTEQIAAPEVPELTSPEDQAAGVSIIPELNWEAADRADTYQVQVATAASFSSSSMVENEPGLSGTNFEPDVLAYETIYYWRVRATNNGGTSDWSEIWTFTTQEEPLQPPAAPTLASPADEATGISINPLLEWEAATDASSYEVQVATDSGFDTTVYEEDGISGLSHTVTADLAYETTHFWRVRAVNAAGESDWSASRSFTTQQLNIPEPPSNLTLETTSGGIRLAWTENEEDDIEEYVIYRGSSTNDLSAYAKVFAGTTTFELNVSNTQFFAVTALNESGNESPFSNIVSYLQSSVAVKDLWQLKSNPTNEDREISTSNQIFSFDGAYRIDLTMTPLKGYWIKRQDSTQIAFNGPGVNSGVIELNEGWNLIGSLSDIVDVNSISDPDEILTSTPIWGYNPESFSYEETENLLPAQGYWIFVSESGSVEVQLEPSGEPEGQESIQPANIVENNTVNDKDYDRIIFTTSGVKQQFLFSGHPLSAKEEQAHLLPPQAPDPLLDIRTAQNYRIASGNTVPVSITAGEYPVRVHIDELHDSKMAYRLELNDGENQIHLPLKPGTPQTIDREYDSVYLSRVSEEELAVDFKLMQNYPNPFNPTTSIEFQIAQQTEVRLIIYNILGREVQTLVNETKQPGIYSVHFDGTTLASGTYIVRMIAGDFVSVQKMTLIK